MDSASSFPAPVKAVDMPMAPSPMRPTSRVPSVACFMIVLPFSLRRQVGSPVMLVIGAELWQPLHSFSRGGALGAGSFWGG